ncbi:MAG: SDR family oxidoreductase [Dehalococcoidales bacterium]|nr:SDR family oxidoreductase [Dehalococcoidales bacterium]
MKVAITGVSGYLGSLLLDRFEQIPEIESITGIDLKPPRQESQKLSFHSLDINGPITRVLADERVDTLLHLAWVFDPIHDEKATRRVDIDGTKNVLQACDEVGVKKIIFTSSTTSYGVHPDNGKLSTENTPRRGHPAFQYSRDKAEAEALFEEYQASHPDTCVSIPRICILAGPHTDNYLSRYVSRSIVFIVQGQDPPFQFIHEDDAVDVLVKLLLGNHPGAFNIAGEGTIHLGDLGRLFGTHLIPVPYSILYPFTALFWALRVKAVTEAPPSVLDFLRYPWVADCSKAKRELGFQPTYTSTQALQSYVEARRANGKWQRLGRA